MTEPNELADTILLRILDPEELYYEGDVKWVQVPIDDGLLGIWPGHAPLVAALSSGTLFYSDGFQRHSRPIEGGLLCVAPEECAVLLGSLAQEPETRDPDKQALFERLEHELYESLSEEQVETLQKE